MTPTARPLAVAAVLAATLVLPAGCFWDDPEQTPSTPAAKQVAAQGPAAGQPEAAQKPRPNSEPLFHATNSTGGRFHEFEISGGFTVRFACKGGGAATVSLNPATKYQFTCTAGAPEQDRELTVSDTSIRDYRVEVTTTSATNTWSLFLDRLLVKTD